MNADKHRHLFFIYSKQRAPAISGNSENISEYDNNPRLSAFIGGLCSHYLAGNLDSLDIA
jgi:hypothetical protein